MKTLYIWQGRHLFCNTAITLAKTLSTRNRVFSKTTVFFSEYCYRPHVAGVIGQRKRRFSNTFFSVEIFENGDLSYSCGRGRAKTEVFKYDDVMPRFQARSSAHMIRKRYVSKISWNVEEKVSVFENTRLRVDGQIRLENATCGCRFFLNTEKYLRFRKYPAACGRGLRLLISAIFNNGVCGDSPCRESWYVSITHSFVWLLDDLDKVLLPGKQRCNIN